MSETRDYQPAGLGGPTEHTTYPSDELAAVNQRMDVLRKEQHEHDGWYLPEWYFLNTKRRILQGVGKEGTTSTEEVEAQLVRTLQETEESGNKNAYQAVKGIRWAFLAYAAEYAPLLLHDSLFLEGIVEQYNWMQQEAIEQTGQRVEGFTLDLEQSQTLVWLLDHAAISHKRAVEEISISLVPLEEQLRAAAVKEAKEHPSETDRYPLIDHEEKARASGLIEQWKQKENTEG